MHFKMNLEIYQTQKVMNLILVSRYCKKISGDSLGKVEAADNDGVAKWR